jgi:hypothetical protein
MAGGRPKVGLILTDDERVPLDSLAHCPRTAPHLARRASIILACAEGGDNPSATQGRGRFPAAITLGAVRFSKDLWTPFCGFHWSGSVHSLEYAPRGSVRPGVLPS